MRSGKPPKAVFFDVGWTLLYPKESLWEAFAAIARQSGGQVDAAGAERTVHGLVGRNRARAIAEAENGGRYSDSDAEFAAQFQGLARLLLGLSGIEGDHEALAGRFLARFWREENWAVFPEVSGALDRLRAAGVRIGVVSNAGSDLPFFLGRVGIADCFDFQVISAIEGTKKPDRRIFERALDRAAVTADQAVHVGDMFLEDVVGARTLGVSPLLIDRGQHSMFPNYPEADPEALGGVDVVHDLDEVLRVLGVA